jgi:hypothetical protein
MGTNGRRTKHCLSKTRVVGDNYHSIKAINIMKILITLLFIFLFEKGYSQNDFDSLKKYFYPIIGIDTAPVDGGSCFFVRHKKNIYLVTAKHILAGCLNDSTKSELFADRHYIFLGSYLNAVELNTSATKLVLPCDGIDLVFCQLVDTSMSKYIYSVEDYLMPDFLDFKSFLIGGFPATGFKKDIMSSFPEMSFLHIQDKYSEILNLPDLNGNYDPNMFGIDWQRQVITGALLDGYSGAPVFIQDRSTLKWKLAGMLSASKSIKKDMERLIIVDVVAILNKLDEIQLLSKVQAGNIVIY